MPKKMFCIDVEHVMCELLWKKDSFAKYRSMKYV